MNKSPSSWLANFIPFVLLVALMAPSAGYRHLWQDEIETAERARSIVESGLPMTIDSSGKPSVNAAGREIEEGKLHRYTPWVQFYVGALGLSIGNQLNIPSDEALRLPFVILHGATSSLLSAGLTVAGMHPAGSVVVATLFGIQSVRMIHNRTARYHVILDFLFLMGLLGLSLSNSRPSLSKIMTATSIFLLPQTHTLAGSLLSSLLVLNSLTRLVQEEGFRLSVVLKSIRLNAVIVILPALVSLILVVFLTRPWAQEAWSPHDGAHEFRSLKSGFEISYSFYFYFLSVIFLAWNKRFRLASILTVLFLYVTLTVRLMDLHPFSQTRYYLSLPIFFLFWFLAYGEKIRAKRGAFAFLSIAVLTPEVQGVIPAFRGVSVVLNDCRLSSRKETQPLIEAVNIVAENSNASEPILFDYVPQFINWYLPNHPIALMPDRSQLTKLNQDNPIWLNTPSMPEWHLRTSTYNGVWNCSPHCDYSSSPISDGRYTIHSKSMNLTVEMCVVKSWSTERCNNAPFSLYEPESNDPAGNGRETLILARKCTN